MEEQQKEQEGREREVQHLLASSFCPTQDARKGRAALGHMSWTTRGDVGRAVPQGTCLQVAIGLKKLQKKEQTGAGKHKKVREVRG